MVDKQGRFYVGITTDLKNRLRQHADAELLYKEGPLRMADAAARERQIKGWSRQKKLTLVKKKGRAVARIPALRLATLTI